MSENDLNMAGPWASWVTKSMSDILETKIFLPDVEEKLYRLFESFHFLLYKTTASEYCEFHF